GLHDLGAVILQPLAVVEGHCTDNASPSAVCCREPALLDGALSKNDLVAEGRHADRLDIDAELARPVRGYREIGTALGLLAHHVVRGDLCSLDGVGPEFCREKLVLV